MSCPARNAYRRNIHCQLAGLLIALGAPSLALAESPPAVAPNQAIPDAVPRLSAPLDELPTPPPLAPPPTFVRLAPYLALQTPVQARVTRKLHFVVQAHDPQGQRLRYSAKGLPPGATFDPVTQVFDWVPGIEAKGTYSPIFIAETGSQEATMLVLIEVGENHAPRFKNTTIRFDARLPSEQQIMSFDPDGDELRYSAASLPKGAFLDENTGMLNWTPGPGDVGQHTFKVTVSDGEETAVANYTVEVIDPETQQRDDQRKEWESFLQPGLGYAFYLPSDQDTYGAFHGIDLQLSLVSWIHRNDNRGPSHGRVYVSVDLMQSPKKSLGPLFVYSLGVTLSLERNPQRSWLIPHYGVEIGGMTQEQMGGKFQSRFFGGVHLWASRNLFVNLEAGYLLVPSDLEELGGFVAGANTEFSLW